MIQKTDSYIISGILEFVHCFRSQSVVPVWAFSRNEEWRNKWKKTDLCVIIPMLPPPKLVTGRRCINCGKSDVFYCRCHGWCSLPLYHQMVRWWQIAGNEPVDAQLHKTRRKPQGSRLPGVFALHHCGYWYLFLPNGIIAYAEIVFKIPGKKISLTKAWSQRDLFDNTNIVMYNKHREAVSWS